MQQRTAYAGVHVLRPSFDGYDRDVTLVVEDGRISRIEKPAGDLSPGTQVFDLSGRYVIPGLVDMHVHVDESTIPNTLEAFLRFGVTTVRDVGSHAELTMALARDTASGRRLGPRIFTFGELVDGPEPFWPDISIVPEDPEQLRMHVERVKGLGVTGVKFYFNLTADFLAAGIQQAKAEGLLTAAHVGGRVSALEAVSLGVGTVEHVTTLTKDLVPEDDWAGKSSFLDQFLLWKDVITPESSLSQKTIEGFRQKGTWMVPTLAVMEAIAFGDSQRIVANPAFELLEGDAVQAWKQMQYTQAWSPEDYANAQAAFAKMQAFTVAYWDAGAPMGVGSDTPNPFVVPGESLLRECELLQESGIPPHAILQMACQRPSEYFSEESDWGSLEPGMAADFVVLNDDPMVDLRALRSPVCTVRAGERVDPPFGGGQPSEEGRTSNE